MRKFLFLFTLTLIFISVMIFKDDIAIIVLRKIYENDTSVYQTNSYTRGDSFLTFQKVDNFSPQNKKDLVNIVYTIIDSGIEEFNFMCPKEYETCIDDISDLLENNTELSHINNFVHPFNSYKKIIIEVNMLGKITVSVTKNYNDSEIKYINDQIDIIVGKVIKDNMSVKQKIKAFHDYIAKNTKYDSDRALEQANGNIDQYSISHKATGVLLNKVALCGGYTDIMAIYLNRLGLENYKISSETHVWNLVELDDIWYHLDVTWDDPVVKDKDIILDDFFLISTNKLLSLDQKQHSFDEDIYLEA